MHAPNTFVGTPIIQPPRSRWRRSATTFGPLGRLSITLIVVAAIPLAFVTMGSAFWPLGLWFLVGYAVVAALVLRDVWRPIEIDPDDQGQPSIGARTSARHPWLARRVPVPGRILVVAGLAIVVVVVVATWGAMDDLHRYFAVAGLVAFALGWWLSRSVDG